MCFPVFQSFFKRQFFVLSLCNGTNRLVLIICYYFVPEEGTVVYSCCFLSDVTGVRGSQIYFFVYPIQVVVGNVGKRFFVFCKLLTI